MDGCTTPDANPDLVLEQLREALGIIDIVQHEELDKIEAITTLAIIAVRSEDSQVSIKMLSGAMAAIRSSARSLSETIGGEVEAAAGAPPGDPGDLGPGQVAPDALEQVEQPGQGQGDFQVAHGSVSDG